MFGFFGYFVQSTQWTCDLSSGNRQSFTLYDTGRQGSAETDEETQTSGSREPSRDTDGGDSSPGGSGAETHEPDSDGSGGGQHAADPVVRREAYMVVTVSQLVGEIGHRLRIGTVPKGKRSFGRSAHAHGSRRDFGNGALPTADRRRRGERGR